MWGILNLWLSKRQINLFHSNWVQSSCWKLWIFWLEQQVWIHFWEHTKQQKQTFFPYEWFDCPNKLLNTELHAYNHFFSKPRNNNPLESEYAPYGKLIESGITSGQATKQLRLDSIPPTGTDNYQSLIDTWKWQKMKHFWISFDGTTTKTLSQHFKLWPK